MTAPEPDSGPGWDREAIAEAVTELTNKDRPDLGAQVTKLLAHFDLMNRTTDRALEAAEGYTRRANDRQEQAEEERDAARAELAEVTADRAAVGFSTSQRYESPPVSTGPYVGRPRPRVTGEVADG